MVAKSRKVGDNWDQNPAKTGHRKNTTSRAAGWIAAALPAAIQSSPLTYKEQHAK